MHRRSAGLDVGRQEGSRFEEDVAKNRNHVETLSMLHSRGMANSRPTVLVTESEYRKAEALFLSAPGLECLRAPDDRGRSRLGHTRGARARTWSSGPRPYSGALYDALPAGGVIARFGVGHDGIDKARATEAGLLCTNTPGVLNQSVAEHTMLLIAAAARTLDRHVNEHGATRVGSGDGRGTAGQDARDYRVRRHRAQRRAHRLSRLRHAGRRLFQAGRAAARGAGALSCGHE